MNLSEILMVSICMQLEPCTVFFMFSAAALQPSSSLLSPLWQLSSPPPFPPALLSSFLPVLPHHHHHPPQNLASLFYLTCSSHPSLLLCELFIYLFFTSTIPFSFSSLPSVEHFPFPAFLSNLLSICFPSVTVVITFSLLSV